MRASVSKRLTRARSHRSRLYLYVSPLLFAAICGLFLAYSNWRVSTDIQDATTAQRALFAKIDASIVETKKKRIAAAQKAEADAKAQADATEAARKAAATANPAGTTNGTKACDVIEPQAITVVVNKQHCFNPMAWAPSDLTVVAGYYMRAEAAAHMQAMIDAAAADGQGFQLSSAYRSYYDQVATYNYWVAINGSQAEADKVSARPGYSEHQTGLAADLIVGSCTLACIEQTSQYQWLVTHAGEYGFILRYPDGLSAITGYEPEPWHWRYVGVENARDMKAKAIQTLEAYRGVSGGNY